MTLGHRQSDDLDFMAMNAQDPGPLIQQIYAMTPGSEILDRSRYGIHWRIQGVKVSYLWQPSVRLDPGATFQEIPLASRETLSVLKCNAIANRGARKDFIDLYALLQDGWSLATILDTVADQAPQLHRSPLLRSLMYFEDAEREPDPRLYHPWTWPEISRTIERHVYSYLRHHLAPPPPNEPTL